MIINSGCRTDIPAFYSKWFMNRIREGYVYVRNPYYNTKVTKCILNPNLVDCLAFCSKNPEPMLKYLDELDKFKQFWFVTITPYGKDIEPSVSDKTRVIESFKKISEHVGINAVNWRYDPIFIGMGFDVERHIKCFEEMARSLKGYVKNCTISFLDLYEKVKRNAPNIKPPTRDEQIEIGKAFSKIGKENGITIHSCCEKTFLAPYGIDCKGCMTKEIVEEGIGCKLNPPKRKNIREDCNCLLGNDIGAYNSCGHLCIYCYANANKELVRKNMLKHDPNSPFLIGNSMPEDEVHLAKQKSWKIDEQISFL